jgi:hypothetical protein
MEYLNKRVNSRGNRRVQSIKEQNDGIVLASAEIARVLVHVILKPFNRWISKDKILGFSVHWVITSFYRRCFWKARLEKEGGVGRSLALCFPFVSSCA